MGRMNVILAAVADNRLFADGSLTGLIFPQNYVEFAADGDETTWSINVRGVVGGPTSWSLEARLLDVVEHTAGPQYSEPQLVPFTPLQTRTFVREGKGFGKPAATYESLPASAGEFAVIADSTDGLGGGTTATITRTVQNFNRRHKLELRPTFVGGTSPGLVIALTAQVN